MMEIGSKWRKVKLALSTKLCLLEPRTIEDESPASTGKFSDAVLLSHDVPPPPHRNSDGHLDMPTTPIPSSSGLRLPRQLSKSSKQRTCAICLNSMKPGNGHAIFTAECSHSFHFQCITSNVKHGNHMCPVCRAKWKDIPFQNPTTDLTHRNLPRDDPWTSVVRNLPRDDPWTSVVRNLPPRRSYTNRHSLSSLPVVELDVFNDDELVDIKNEPSHVQSNGGVEIKTFTELPAISKSDTRSDFSIVVHLKAPPRTCLENSRAPVDLVTVLDVSGSMAGTKLALLKRAMGFVIQNLCPSDRLSVIAFSSISRRLFPLRRMNDTGKKDALQAVNELFANGGTNISEALKMGEKVLSECKSKNPVSSIILLSDGQDTYATINPGDVNKQSLLPLSMHRDHNTDSHIPVHTFGFGVDHDSVSMHSISETSGGTFSFIEAESVIQDAFAQCIGGLLSVTVQDLVLHVECLHPDLHLTSMKTGSYKNSLDSNGRFGAIEVGDLYAEEERDFLVRVHVPADKSSDEMSLLTVRCSYKNPISKELVNLNHCADAKILRPETTGPVMISMEVDKQRNRVHTAESMSEAKAAAEHGDLSAAVLILANCRKQLAESVSLKAGDRLSIALDAELSEMQERMANQQIYETSGRAYVLSGLSSHSWQRATARGDSTESTSMVHAYQTPSMVDMVNLSQTMMFSNPNPRRSLRPTRSARVPRQTR